MTKINDPVSSRVRLKFRRKPQQKIEAKDCARPAGTAAKHSALHRKPEVAPAGKTSLQSTKGKATNALKPIVRKGPLTTREQRHNERAIRHLVSNWAKHGKIRSGARFLTRDTPIVPIDRVLPPETSVKPQVAAQYLGLSVKTLANHRCNGAGPSFVRIGRGIRYKIGDLDAFFQKNITNPASQLSNGGKNVKA